jgi:pimeloyl-ACP methyl ester carboxylesterase
VPRTDLPRGATHYELDGPADARLLVMLHGGTAPSWTFEPLLPELTAAGFRVLRYDLYGRGRSASPRGAHDRALYRAQLLDLLDALNLRAPIDLLGFSFGGATAASFAAHHPQRVARLALIAPVLHFAATQRAIRWLRLPLLGPLFLHHIGMKKAPDAGARLWAGAADSQSYRRRYAEQLQGKDFERAFLAFARSDALDDYTSAYRQAGRHDRPVLLLWGDADRDIPRAHIEALRQALPRCEYHELAGISHGVPFLAPEAVNRHLLRFLA